MTDYMHIYQKEALRYEQLVSREDAQNRILPAIRAITKLEGRDVVEFGAGTGRLTCLLAPHVRSIRAFDIALPMLKIAEDKLRNSGLENWQVSLGDHRSLPVEDKSADIIISGWSICHLVDFYPQTWQNEIEKALAEMRRILREGGKIVLLETQGTGFETPHPPHHLLAYYQFLADQGFSASWIRTDYRFASLAEALDLSGFFFGEPLTSQIRAAGTLLLPECTGIWFK